MGEPAQPQHAGGNDNASANSVQRIGQKPPVNVATGLQGLFSPPRAPKRSERFSPSRCTSDRADAASSASTRCGPANEAFQDFLRLLRLEKAAQGESLSKLEAMKQWKELPDQDRQNFKREALERRRREDAAALEEARRQEREALERVPTANQSSSESTSAAMLRKLREQEASRKPVACSAKPAASSAKARSLSPAASAAKRRRKGEEAPRLEIPRPVFPKSAITEKDRASRRREIAEAAKVRSEGATVSVPSSSGLSLAEVSARLDAPTLSCDWQTAADDSDAEEALLEVDKPEHCNGREFLNQELQRRISADQVRKLSHEEHGHKIVCRRQGEKK